MAKANPPVHLTRELWLTKLVRSPSYSFCSAASRMLIHSCKLCFARSYSSYVPPLFSSFSFASSTYSSSFVCSSARSTPAGTARTRSKACHRAIAGLQGVVPSLRSAMYHSLVLSSLPVSASVREDVERMNEWQVNR